MKRTAAIARISNKILCLLFVGSLLSIFTLNLGVCFSPNATIPFSLDELSGQIWVTSPIENFTYSDSTLVVNASLIIGGIEHEPNTHYVPYQNISCVYSLDDSEWREMSLVSIRGPEAFSSLVNPVWYSNTWLNYTATLHNVSGGQHHLRIGVKPDSIPTRDLNSGQQQPLVYFNIISQPPLHPAFDPLPILLSAFVLALVALFSVGLLIYFKKRKRKIVVQ